MSASFQSFMGMASSAGIGHVRKSSNNRANPLLGETREISVKKIYTASIHSGLSDVSPFLEGVPPS